MSQIVLGGSVGVQGSVFVLGNATVNFATDANHTLLASEWANYYLALTSTGSLTATRNLIAPLNPGQTFLVENNTTGGQAVQVLGASGTGVLVASGQAKLVGTDGVNYFAIGGGGGSVTVAASASGPGATGTLSFPVPTGTSSVELVATMRVVSTSGMTEAVGDSFSQKATLVWKNVGGTVSKVPTLAGLSWLAADASMATGGSFAQDTNGAVAEIDFVTPSTLAVSTALAVSISVQVTTL
jgi:hypothetical protein